MHIKGAMTDVLESKQSPSHKVSLQRKARTFRAPYTVRLNLCPVESVTQSINGTMSNANFVLRVFFHMTYYSSTKGQ